MTLVSDEVWRQLDPDAGRLSRRAVLRLRWSLAAAVALALLAGVVWQSGLVVPRVGWRTAEGYGWSNQGLRVEFEVWIGNTGWTTVDVMAVGRSGPGFALQEVRAELPTTLRPGQIMLATLVYQVTDCAAVPADAWPVPVTIHRTWGTATGYVQPPTVTSPAAPVGAREWQGRDPYALEWQRGVADYVCNPR